MKQTILLVALLWLGPDVHAATLEPAELDRVDAMLVRIADAGIDPLLPLGQEPTAGEVEGRPRLALARSIKTFQAQLDTLGTITRGDVLPLLLLARHYAQLGMSEESVEWYRHAYVADLKSEHVSEILREQSLAALASGDSTLLHSQTELLARRADAPQYSALLGRLLAALASTGERDTALEFTRRLEPRAAELAPPCLVELATLRQESGSVQIALEHWRALLGRGAELDLPMVARTLRGLADSLFLMGRFQDATTLYRRYQMHDTGLLSAWSTYQLAGLSAMSGDYDPAIRGFRSLCEREERTPWQDESCWRLTQAQELQSIEAALLPFRRALHGR